MSAASMYFIAIVCPPQVEEKVHEYKIWMRDQFGCIAALKSPAHITLMKPFWLEDSWETYLVDTLQSFNSAIAAPEIELEDFSHFGKRVLFVDVKQSSVLTELRTQVQNHFIHSFGDTLKKDQFSFYPHVTIANRDLKPGDFDKAWEHFKTKTFAEKFVANGVSLINLLEGKWNILSSKQLIQA